MSDDFELGFIVPLTLVVIFVTALILFGKFVGCDCG